MTNKILPKPEWIRRRLGGEGAYSNVSGVLSQAGLTTVCEGARCPNRGECWSHGTATIMIMGSVCSRDCRFCDVNHGCPSPLDSDEPFRVAEAVSLLNLKYAVITSVTRDDLSDGGAAHWAETIIAVRDRNPKTKIEVLIPDFKGEFSSLESVLAAQPDVVGHNLETVPRLYPSVRPSADYEQSLILLERAVRAGFITKTGLMVGLGETKEEVLSVLEDARKRGVSIVTIGQYLQPSRGHLPVERYLPPEEFDQLERTVLEMGFTSAFCGPFVRSSYLADKVFSKNQKESAL